MKWIKKGKIFNFHNTNEFFVLGAMLPIPNIMKNRVRFVISAQDKNGAGRPTYIDSDINDFTNILYINEAPLIDIGFPVTFDQDGCVALSIVDLPDGKKYMYYVGFELGTKSRYRMLTGLAIAEDGIHYKKYENVPILERSDKESLFRCGNYVTYENGVFRMWYVAGDSWSHFEGKDLPNYVIKYMESNDGIHWGTEGVTCIKVEHENEHGFGRPYVIYHDGMYKMFYSIRKKNLGYRLGYAESKDGIHWVRMDDTLNLDVSKDGWDSDVIAYSSVVNIRDKWYMFYNGNGMGKSGFGYAELVEW